MSRTDPTQRLLAALQHPDARLRHTAARIVAEEVGEAGDKLTHALYRLLAGCGPHLRESDLSSIREALMSSRRRYLTTDEAYAAGYAAGRSCAAVEALVFIETHQEQPLEVLLEGLRRGEHRIERASQPQARKGASDASSRG